MKVELVDLEEFSGNKAHIYSVLLDDAEDTLFDQFVEENGPLYPNEIREIVKELIAMGNKVGCQEHFFKLNEGRLGDGVAAVINFQKKRTDLGRFQRIDDAIKARKDAEDRLFNRFLKELNEQTH